MGKMEGEKNPAIFCRLKFRAFFGETRLYRTDANKRILMFCNRGGMAGRQNRSEEKLDLWRPKVPLRLQVGEKFVLPSKL